MLDRSSRDELLAYLRLADRTLDWLEGQRAALEKDRPERLDRWLGTGGWLVGVICFGTGAIDAFLNGLSAWGVASLSLAPLGFLFGAWQTQRQIARERLALEAATAWAEQVQLIKAAVEKLNLALRGEAPEA